MKTKTYTVFVTLIALSSVAVNAFSMSYIFKQATVINDMREECSFDENVHISKCVIKAVNISERADQVSVLLPPRELQWENN